METLRLQTLQKSSHIERLLRSLVKSLGVVPEGMDASWNRSDLPWALQQVVIRAGKEGQSWCAWTDRGFQAWLFVGEMSLLLSRQRGSPVLRVKHYRESGLREAAAWLVDRQGNWHRCVD
jgi:hypothetical protein